MAINWKALSGEKDEKTPKDLSQFFKLTKDEHTLRIVPFPLNSKLFDSKYFNEDNNVFCKILAHKSRQGDIIPYNNGKATLSLECIGQEDPIANLGKKLWYENNDKNPNKTKGWEDRLKIADALKADRPVYVCVIDRDDESATPKLWRVTNFFKKLPLFIKADTKLRKKLGVAEDDNDFEWYNVSTGFDMTIETVEDSYNNNKYLEISSVTFDTTSTPVAESKEALREIYSAMPNPFDLYHILSYTELDEILQKNMNGDEPDDDSELKSKPKPKPVVKKQTLDEEDEDEEDEPAPKPVTKPVAKKQLVDEDEDDEDEAPKPVTKQKNFDAIFKGKDKKKLVAEQEDDDVPY
jgi:hypothetical protein